MAEKTKQSFVIYRNWMEMIMGLPDEQALDLARTIFAYCLNRDYTSGSVASAIFDTIEPKLEEDMAEWERICELRRQAGAKGGKQKVANAKQMLPNAKQMVAKGKHLQTDNDNDNDNDYENVNDTDNDTALTKVRDKKEDAYASKKEIVDALMAKWNSFTNRGHIPLVRSVARDGKTWKSVLARVEENGIEDAADVIQAVFDSSYLRGEVNGWFAKFDWVFLPSNYEKVKNGNYTDSPTTRTQNAMQKQNDMLADWVEEYDSIQYGGNGA